MITPRERVERALRGEAVSPVPFTMYECMIPQCTAERLMRNRGMCIVKRDVPVYRTMRPNVKVTQHVYWERDKQFTRTAYETPVGTLTTLGEAAGFTTWWHERMFKGPSDYAALRFLVNDEVYEPTYASFSRAEKALGPDIILRSNFGLEPLQALISGSLMRMEDFCFEWMDRRDEILALYRILVEKRRQLYPIIAESPVGHANYGGNVVPSIIGADVFWQYYVPHYNEAAEIMHRHGKYIGCHFDADSLAISDAIASTELDYVEAFTPAPDTDMTLAQARAAWPDKVLWLNFPSSLHLLPDEQVERSCYDLVDELDSCAGLLMGITEDIPESRWQGSCTAIMNGLDLHAQERRDKYRVHL